jgi:hypothetical protein
MNPNERFLKLKKMFAGKSNGNKNVPVSSKPRQFSTPTI